MIIHRLLIVSLCLFVAEKTTAQPQESEPREVPGAEKKALIAQGVALLLQLQEGDDHAEWPYEGVYRVRGDIPIGYRVGGTAIVASTLLLAPGYDGDEPRQQAVKRATRFIVQSRRHPLMAHEVEATYDVRGWGYTYGLAFLLQLHDDQDDQGDDDDHALAANFEEEFKEEMQDAIRFFIDGIEATAIPTIGGWNYARGQGFSEPARPSPFMTGPTLQALFESKRQGFEVDEAIIESGLDALEKGRTATGSFVYAGTAGLTAREPVPGSVGRMLVAESTLCLAGRSSVERIRGALDAFIAHWSWLEKRRAQQGTHLPPYGIAPYYFYFAHYYAAQAVELLPQYERGEYRRRVRELLMSVQLEDGSWNDRVFPRSANYGTAMALGVLLMPDRSAPARYGESEGQGGASERGRGSAEPGEHGQGGR